MCGQCEQNDAGASGGGMGNGYDFSASAVESINPYHHDSSIKNYNNFRSFY